MKEEFQSSDLMSADLIIQKADEAWQLFMRRHDLLSLEKEAHDHVYNIFIRAYMVGYAACATKYEERIKHLVNRTEQLKKEVADSRSKETS